ncbi:MAG TPA: ABC transporter ATP-binding protein [Sedimentibacter sp.]|jgi:ATP-binding cassette subfamily B protein|nr:ABC transporter ATP-binding protein [Tissierellia bacterium]HOA20031.1 ABC transporter ATP-binding protein [Sedimentibacter sp.]HOG63158.1 ABC transporter ATP-binding protein [Sedimentibacter sp.]HOT21522.1 ABC transporter ATP-binding protein [Sedimentibacter sp.]HPB79677.1 ABC transporter ATP-binding protein [Sedimentibacter sp.]
MLKRFIAYYKPVKIIFITDMICAFAVAVCDLFYPMITRNIINIYVPNQEFQLMIKWLVVLGFIYILKFGLNYYITYYGHIMGVKMQAHMRKDIFEHLQDLPFVFFDENKTGTLSSRIINDLMDISELAHHGPEDLFISLVMLIGSFIMLSTINLPLSLIVFSAVPLLLIVAMKLRLKMEDAFMETRVTIGEVNATIENSISGIRVSKAFSNKENEIEKFEKNNSRFQEARRKAYKVMAEFHVGSSFIIDILNIVVLSSGAIFFFIGIINFGDFAAFLLYTGNFLNPIRKLVNFVEQYQSGSSGFKRFIEIMDKDVEKDDPGAADIYDVKGEISFDDVSFAYDDNKEILKDITFDIEAGKTVAIVGPSGGGKTTLCHLIPRFYEIEEGSISIDNIDIRKFTRKSLRKNIGIVQQDVFLFTGTILENIQCGKLDATKEEVYKAAKNANIHDFIMSLPEGYDTYVGERGVKLSGGQKQRISIARVFLKNPPIIILDEATSALDNATEFLIQKALDELSKGRTTIVVAHRLSTIKNADEIIVLTDQGIQEKGRHQELLDKKGMYAGLYNSQFINQ